MKSFASKLFVLATFAMGCAAQAQIANPKLTVNATVEIAGTDVSPGDIASHGSIQGSTLSRSCLLLTRQKAKWQTSDNKTGSVTFGDYEPKGATTAANFQQFGIPNGALIDPILDVSASSDIDLDYWFTVDYSSSCVAMYECTGSVFKYTYKLTGYNCAIPIATVPKNGQCGGIGYTGPTVCAAGSTCQVLNPYYSQCL